MHFIVFSNEIRFFFSLITKNNKNIKQAKLIEIHEYLFKRPT